MAANAIMENMNQDGYQSNMMAAQKLLKPESGVSEGIIVTV